MNCIIYYLIPSILHISCRWCWWRSIFRAIVINKMLAHTHFCITFCTFFTRFLICIHISYTNALFQRHLCRLLFNQRYVPVSWCFCYFPTFRCHRTQIPGRVEKWTSACASCGEIEDWDIFLLCEYHENKREEWAKGLEIKLKEAE